MSMPYSSKQLGPTLGGEELVARARGGDQAATQELLRRYRPLLARNVRRFSVYRLPYDRVVDVEDAWQEAHCAFLMLLRQYDPARGVPFGGYVRTLLAWHFLNMQRQLAHEPAPSLDAEELTAVIDPAEDTNIVVLREALRHLSPREYQVLAALYLDGRSTAEVAQEIGITRRTVNATHRRALAKLQHLLGPEGIAPDVRRR